MFTFFRAILFATLFVALFLIYVPANLLSAAGIDRSPEIGWRQVFGLAVGTIGAVIALWCVLVFGSMGKGTPAPFDPPRNLVIRGPYRIVRNPMYIGAAAALTGGAVYYQSLLLLLYVLVFILLSHLFVVTYEEPKLRRSFGREYEEYCHRVNRWWPAV